MLAIDDVKRLAKMQELLLERTSDNREANLNNYKRTVIQIDEDAFSNLISKIDQVNDHNQTLEEELEFLEQIRDSYQQVLEQQLGFRRVCELYGDEDLKLSDLSQIDIEYIESRINAINGYLINQRNIENNKIKLQQLNEALIMEEKNRTLLSRRLLELESILRKNFIDAEGRSIVNGELQYISVISEYKDLELDFKHLLEDTSSLELLLSKVNVERIEVDEKLRTAEICYNSVPSVDSKQILDDITRENLRVKYKLTMLKILELLSMDCDNYDLFRKKREDLLDLIKYRLSCLVKLGVHISIDPFSRVKVSEQLESVSSLSDNSKNINKLKKEIAELSQRLEESVSQNSAYMFQINDTRNLVVSRTRISDIDISGISLGIEEYYEEKPVSDNQVINLRVLPKQFNGAIVRQKTNRVIKRVNEMVNSISLEKEENEPGFLSPELVIVPQMVVSDDIKEVDLANELQDTKNDSIASFDDGLFADWSESFKLPISNDAMVMDDDSQKLDGVSDDLSLDFADTLLNFVPNEVEQDADTGVNKEEDRMVQEEKNEEVMDMNLFSSVDPFLEAPLFTDRTDDEVDVTGDIRSEAEIVVNEPVFAVDDQPFTFSELDRRTENNDESVFVADEKKELIEEMPEAFWVTQDDNVVSTDSEVIPSFDEQINALLSEDENEVKTRKLVA